MIRYEQLHTNPDIFVIPVPLARGATATSNCFVVICGAEALIIDTGIPNPGWATMLREDFSALGISDKHASILLTHTHIDHAGLLKRMSGIGTNILMSRQGYQLNAPMTCLGQMMQVRQRLHREGIRPTMDLRLSRLVAESNISNLIGRNYLLLDDGDTVHVSDEAFTVIATPGHDRGHICLFHPKTGILFSGDLILKGISPGLSLPLGGHDSVQEYLNSLDTVEALQPTVAYPGHGDPVKPPSELIDQLRTHHMDRLNEVVSLVAERPGSTGKRIVRSVGWNVPAQTWDDVSLYQRVAIYEQGIAYLEHLVLTDRIIRETDASNVFHYYESQ